MAGGISDILDGCDDKHVLPSLPQRSNALTNKLSNVLSASYADPEIREALRMLDARNVQNSSTTRRRLRLDVQKEVLECNGRIVKEFGHVAEVCSIRIMYVVASAEKAPATQTHWIYNRKSQQIL